MSVISQRFLACLFVASATTFFLGFLTTKVSRSPSIKRETLCACGGSRLTTDTITPLENNRTFIIAAYNDSRGHSKDLVRILSIVHHEEVKELYCWFCCANKSVRVSRAHIDLHIDRFDFPYGMADLLCVEPAGCHARYLSVHTSSSGNMTQLPLFQIRNSDTKQFTAKFTVCISTLFGNYNNVLQFIQTVEMYQILGAQRVVIYLNGCSQQVERVIKYYTSQGILEVIPWPIQEYLMTGQAWHYSIDPKDIGYYGQLATLNDCIYRNMYRSRFILLNDIDEVILPFQHQTWDTLMNDLQQQHPGVGIFLFENHIFPQTVATNGHFSNTSSWKDVPGSNILQYVHREPDRPDYFNARKMIVNPRRVIQTSVHSVLKGLGKSITVPLEKALVYHCRGPLQKNLTKTSLIEDKTIWRFNASLIRNVNSVLNQITLT